ncbi:hypothetical protein [Chitinophaga agri]|uniref:Uncharacterized protein n=1 Tax=Chitinophaga agri TaxID=2703787 RepID=A0A6B9ZLL5_9BACT|nr:hypothetical protein [Chitinophaga agri]QHS63320.1 hypothetical protein GWR21_28155 [Chitinophaga agri]
MKFFVNPNDIVLEFWTRKGYNPAPYQEVKGFYFTEEEAATNVDAVNLFDHFLTLAGRDGYLTYSSHEYTNPDGTPMKLYSLTPLGRELGQRLQQAATA